MPCEKCGQVHERCSAHKRFESPGVELPGGPRPCRRRPMKGQTVCMSHGGKAAAAKAAAADRIVEQKAAAAMRKFAGPIETTATEALLDTVKWTAGYVAWLRERVEQVAQDSADGDRDLVWGKTQEKTGGDDWGTTHKAGPNVWLALLGEWQDRLVKVCAAAISAGIEERKVRLAEQQGAMVADVIKRILDDLKLTGDQLGLVSEVVPRHLRLLTG